MARSGNATGWSIATKGSMRNAMNYRRLRLFVAGLGGLLYGIDIGIIAAALLYLGKTITLSVSQTSLIVAAVLGGSMISSPFAGLASDWFGRKRMMLVAGLMFVTSIGLIVLSQSFESLFFGRLIQGMSGGVIAVVVPLYLAETLDANQRGRGTAIFQLMLNVGIAIAAVIGWFYTRQAEAAIARVHGDLALIHAAQNHAWRGMFLSVIYPGCAFFLGSLLLAESPRWLMRKGRAADALASLMRSSDSEAEAHEQLARMEAQQPTATEHAEKPDSLWRRKYIVPFVLACIVLACNQTTGINSILSFLVVILSHAGMSATYATQGDVAVKVLNCLTTLIGVALVDRKGRRFLLKFGTAGIIVALAAGAVIFHQFEAKSVDATQELSNAVQGNSLHFPVQSSRAIEDGGPVSLTVLYSYGSGVHLASGSSRNNNAVVEITPDTADAHTPLHIHRAYYTPAPGAGTGWAVAACLALFIVCYSVGPGVVVWLMLTELMPTRIRSKGMGIALLINQGVSTAIAAAFLPVVGNLGYYAMFALWAGSTGFYFLTSTFFLPETKGKTLEEMEPYFDR